MTVRGYFLPAFSAPWLLASACDCRKTTGSPVAPSGFGPVLFRFTRLQGVGLTLYIVFLALDFNFFYVRIELFCRCLRFPPLGHARRPLGTASMTSFTLALSHPMSRPSGFGGRQAMGFAALSALQ